MNVDRIQQLIDRLKLVEEEHPEAFNMDDWFSMSDDDGIFAETAWISGNIKLLDEYSCGTVGCIAGWACATFWDELKPEEIIRVGDSGESPRVNIPATAAVALGLDDTERQYLFIGWWTDTSKVLEQISVGEAIEELEFILADPQQFEDRVSRYRNEDLWCEGGSES